LDMTERRIIGLDLGIASEHTARVLNGEGKVVAKRKAIPTTESLSALEQAALAGAPPGTVLEIVMEPTGPAWLPIAVFFISRGHQVFRVPSAKAHDMRRYFSRNAKSNSIDADALAKLAIIDADGLRPLVLNDADEAALDRRVRACDRLTQEASLHKRRIKDLVRQLLPMTPLTGDLGLADLAVLERWADPHDLVKAGRARLTKVITAVSHGHQKAERADEWLAAAREAIELYGEHPGVAFADLAAEVGTEIRLLKTIQAELVTHERAREDRYRSVDPDEVARSLPGIKTIGAPALVATMGRAARFPNAAHFRSFTGLAPKTSETGNTDRKGQAMSKAGNSLLRTTLIRAADHARREDPQLARIYYVQMTERGKTHLAANCVVAAHLAERAWLVMRRGTPYMLCDVGRRVVTPREAKAIIAERYTVSEDVRRRQRSKKGGKAPQKVLKEHSKSHAMGVDRTRRPSPATTPARRETDVKRTA
jgi:transposase